MISFATCLVMWKTIRWIGSCFTVSWQSDSDATIERWVCRERDKNGLHWFSSHPMKGASLWFPPAMGPHQEELTKPTPLLRLWYVEQVVILIVSISNYVVGGFEFLAVSWNLFRSFINWSHANTQSAWWPPSPSPN